MTVPDFDLMSPKERRGALLKNIKDFSDGIPFPENEYGFVLGKMSYEEFFLFLEKHGENPKLHLWLHEDGTITTFGFASMAHESVGWAVGFPLATFLNERKFFLHKNFKIMTAPRVKIRSSLGLTSKEPDLAVFLIPPKNTVEVDSEGNAGPTFVLETAFKNENFVVLRKELALWLSPGSSVSLALGIKIFPLNTKGIRRLVAVVATRGEEDVKFISYEFGTDLQEVAPIPLAISSIFGTLDLPDNLVSAVFNLDLMELRAAILSKLRF